MKVRFDQLDGLRGVAALVVALHHGVMVFDRGLHTGLPEDQRFPWDPALVGKPFLLFTAGDFAVSLFFILSGFVLAQSFLRSPLGFLGSVSKRYVRLTMPIVVTSLLALTAAVVITNAPLPGAPTAGRSAADLWGALRFCLFEALYKSTVSGVSTPTYNGVLWTIPIEFQGSVLLIALVGLIQRVTTEPGFQRNLLGVTALLWLLAAWHSRLGGFAVGAALYTLVASGRMRPSRRIAVPIAVLVLGVFLGTMPEHAARIEAYDRLIRLLGFSPEEANVALLQHPLAFVLPLAEHFPYRFTPVGFWHAVGATLVLVSVLGSDGLGRLFSSRICLWLGRVSFMLYLVHATSYLSVGLPLFGALAKTGVGELPASILSAAASMVVAFAVADILSRTVERSALLRSAGIGALVDRSVRRSLDSVVANRMRRRA